MNIGSLCAGQFRKILALLKKKESLEPDLARVADAINRFQTGEDVALEAGTKGQVKVVPVGTGKPKGRRKSSSPDAENESILVILEKAGGGTDTYSIALEPVISKKSSKRGTLRNKVLEVFEKAGDAGASVPDIAAAIGANVSNLSFWFISDAKIIDRIYKIRPWVYPLKAMR